MKNIFILFICFCACSRDVDLVNYEQINSEYPVILYRSIKTKKISIVRFPLVFNISLNHEKKVDLRNPNYYCNSKYLKHDFWEAGSLLYFKKTDSLLLLKSNADLRFLTTNPREYVIYTRHYDVDTSNIVQNMFSSFIDRMEKEGKDTLHIESISQLKQTNTDLVYGLLKGDSIKFIYYYNNFFHSKYVPVEVK